MGCQSDSPQRKALRLPVSLPGTQAGHLLSLCTWQGNGSRRPSSTRVLSRRPCRWLPWFGPRDRVGCGSLPCRCEPASGLAMAARSADKQRGMPCRLSVLVELPKIALRSRCVSQLAVRRRCPPRPSVGPSRAASDRECTRRAKSPQSLQVVSPQRFTTILGQPRSARNRLRLRRESQIEIGTQFVPLDRGRLPSTPPLVSPGSDPRSRSAHHPHS